jgi:hypothetical protein
LLRDGNGGANFAAGNVPQVNNAFGAGQASVTCNQQSNPLAGTEIPGADFWLQGTMQPWILPDPLDAGSVYVVANDDPDNAYGSGDDADVVIARSSDFGVTFTRSRVDHGPGQSFAVMPTAHIDQDGKIAVHWYDNRGNLMNNGTNANFGTANFLLDLYGTTSDDGGQTFANDFLINDAPFDPDVGSATNCRFGSIAGNNCTIRIGEYNGVWTVDAIGYATWTGNATPPAAPFPSDGAGAQTTYFDVFSLAGAFPDRLEPNESVDFAVVADLGTDDTYNQAALSIHTATDVDFFKVVPLHSGKLEVSIQFNEVISDLDIRVRGVAGTTIATGTIDTLVTGSSVVMAALPVVQGGTYFVEVFDMNAPNEFAPQAAYDLVIVNRSAPKPFGIDLLSASDSGRQQDDDITNDDTPTVRLQANMADAADMGIDILTPAEVAAGDDGYAVAVFDNGSFAGYASPVSGTGSSVWEFTFPAALSNGSRAITAKVRVFDDAMAQASGFGDESGSLVVMIDTIAPAAPSTPDLLASSDSGASDADNITAVNPPAFQGTGEAIARVRVRADGAVVGEEDIGSDGTDGVVGNNLGAWEVTVEPLADGSYSITAEAEDLAGNISALSAALAPPLTIDTPDGGGRPQRPTIDLIAAFDTGMSDLDNVTKLATLDVSVTAETGTTVDVKDGNTVIDTFVMPGGGVATRTLILSDGAHPLSAEATDPAGNTSDQSEELLVTVDTSAPATPATPDLLPSSDSGGISIDNITTIMDPAFRGTVEPNAKIRILADAAVVGEGQAGSTGTFEVTVEPLGDGVYGITAEAEDLAGNVSGSSAALAVTIANQALTLAGANAGVVVDLDDSRLTGYPGIPGGTVGILGIPEVNLEVNGNALTILGTSGPDALTYTPNGLQSGTAMLGGRNQVINFSAVGGTFTIDPVNGDDVVSVNGTVGSDTIAATLNTTFVVQVNSLLAVNSPSATVERVAVAAGEGTDTVDVTVHDAVNASATVNGGVPSTNPKRGDRLRVRDGSGRAKIRTQPSAVKGSGSVLISYDRTTGNQSRIDYVEVERTSKAK